MRLESLLTVVALSTTILARFWGGRDSDVAQLDNEGLHSLGKRTTTTTVYETIDDTPATGLVTTSTVVFVEHIYTTPGYSTWLNFQSDSWASTSTTFTTTTVTHIPHIVYSTTTGSDARKIQLAKRSTVSITDWVTVTRDPGNPEGTSEASSSSETLTNPPMGSPQAPPSSATAAASTASLSSSGSLRPNNSSTLASLSPSSTSAVSGAPPISSLSSSASTATSISSAESSSSASLAAPPAPVTSTAPIPSESLTEPAAPSSSSESLPTPSGPHPPVSPSDLAPSSPLTTDRHPHRSTLETLTTGFSAPVSSTLTFVMPSHEGTHFSLALGPSSEEAAPAAPTLTKDVPPSVGDEAPSSVTAPFTLTLTAPPESSSGVRCDDSWCSSDGTSYCMRWDGISGTNSFGMATPGEVFTTIGLCTKTIRTHSQAPTPGDGPDAPAATPLRPGSDRMRLA